ncbi:MAG: response regulator [Desulfobulbaceae bacterium]|nr:response regulator [Desulfobulbaceae bacterium]
MNYKDIRVLVVDDTSTMRTILKVLLKNMGIDKVSEASDGEMALQLLRRMPVDLILSDWNMPRMTGIELLQEVRQDVLLKDIPFIMVSAEASGEYIARAIQHQVSQYLIKPFTAAQLEQKVGMLFAAPVRPGVAHHAHAAA